MTASIICLAIFGSSLGPTVEDVIGRFSEFQTEIGKIDLISLFRLPGFLPRWRGPRVRRSAVRIRTVMAGQETTANTLSWAWHLWSRDRETGELPHIEVDALDGQSPAPIQPRVAAQARRIAARDVSAEAVVVLVPWLLHRHRTYWAEPDGFVPDRFVPSAAETPNRYACVPSSVGPRICTGAASGLTEAERCLATISQQCHLRLRDDWKVMPTCRLGLRPGDQLPMRLIARWAA